MLRAQKEKFVTQAAQRGVPPQTIDAVFKAFEPFERYGFNKLHATCYGLIAYQTAYLKGELHGRLHGDGRLWRSHAQP